MCTRHVKDKDLVAVQVKRRIGRERDNGQRDLGLGIGLHPQEFNEALRRHPLPNIVVGDDQRTGLAQVRIAPGMVEVPVRVQNELHRFAAELCDRRLDLRRQRRELVVDHEDRIVTDRQAQVAAFANHHVRRVGQLFGLDFDLCKVLLRERGQRCCEKKKKQRPEVRSHDAFLLWWIIDLAAMGSQRQSASSTLVRRICKARLQVEMGMVCARHLPFTSTESGQLASQQPKEPGRIAAAGLFILVLMN